MIKPEELEGLELADPDELTFGEIFAIKAATGMDVLDLDGTTTVPALTWYALKQRRPATTWSEVLQLKPTHLNPLASALTARITAEKAKAEAQRQASADAAAVLEQAEAMGEELPAAQEPEKDPT